MKPVVGKDGVPDRRPVIGDPSHLALDSGFASASQSMVVTTLQPNTPLLLVPCTHGPGAGRTVAMPWRLYRFVDALASTCVS